MKKKIIIAIFTLLSIVCLALGLSACDIGGSSSTFELTGESYTLKRYNGGNEAVIPKTYKGLPVTAIGDKAFYGCTSLNSVTIPDSVTSIGEYAFEYCTSLTRITIGKGVVSIGENAFYQCTSLTSIYVTDLKAWCNIEFSDSDFNPLTYAHNLYLNNELVTEITADMLQEVTDIKNYAFNYCTNLTSVTIPDNVFTIGDGAFNNCTSLKSVTISESVHTIGDGAFYNCTNLTDITIGSNVTFIGENAFNNCTSLKSVTIPESVHTIGDSAFYNCTNLASVTISDGVAFINEMAFYNCANLISITIPQSVWFIGDNAFYNCHKLIEVINLSTLPIVQGEESYGCVAKYAFKVELDPDIGSSITKDDDLEFYETFSNVYFLGYTGDDTEIELPSQLNGRSYEIYCNAFYRNEKITKVTIPDSVTSIGDNAFGGCVNLVSVIIGNGATSIGATAFGGCTNLVSVIIGNGVTSIGAAAFIKCVNLAEITIPASVTFIGEFAFSDCTNLVSVTFENVHDWFFGGPKKDLTDPALNATLLKDTYSYMEWQWFGIPTHTHSYGTWVAEKPATCSQAGTKGHYQCSGCKKYFDEGYQEKSLDSLTIPATGHNYDIHNKCTVCNSELQYTKDLQYTLINDNKGYEVSGIGSKTVTEIVIPPYYNELPVTSIGSYAFRGCESLESITIPDNVTTIGQTAFDDTAYYNKLSNWTNNVLYIGKHLINAKGTLSGNYDIRQGTKTIAYCAFYNCTSLESITIPDSVTSIGWQAFRGCESLKKVTIPDSVTSIGNGAFIDCISLESITIPDSVTSIGPSAFYNTAYYNKSSNWAYKVLYIGKHLIKAKETLSGNYDIQQNTITIAGGAFSKCPNLTKITIPISVTSIGDSAFQYCTGLTSITIPNGVTSLGVLVFENCTNLETVYWNATNCEIAENGDYPIFYGSTALTTIQIGENVENIPADAFYKCSSLTNIAIPNSVTSIGERAFGNCTRLTSVTIGNGVISIGKQAFYSCTNIESVYITDIKAWCNIEFGDAANPLPYAQNLYLNNQLLTEITSDMLQGVIEIKSKAFSSFKSLTSVTIPDSVTSIGERAFSGCNSLTSVTFKNTKGWVVSPNSNMSNAREITVTNNTAQNAELLKTYEFWYWQRYDN